MTNVVRSRWTALRGASLALVLGIGSAAPTEAGDDGGAGDCPQGTEPYLAAGEWKGTFKIVYEPVIPGVPEGIKTTTTWEGEISFQVQRPEREDPPPAERPSRRRPLAPPLKEGEKPPVVEDPDRAAPGQFANVDEQRAAILAWYAEQARKEEEAAKERARKYGSQITPSGGRVEKPQIRGGGKGKVTMSLAGILPDARANASGRSAGEANYELSAVQEDGDRPIKRLEVKGDPREAGFTYDATASGRGGRASKSGSSPAAPTGTKIVLTYLEIEDVQCGIVTGHIDATAIREHTRKNLPGYDMRVSTNTWTAKRSDRDESLEQRVEALVNQPIPAQLSWGYLDEFTNKAAELRASVKSPSDYHRCVLKALEGKFVKICRAMIKELGKNFPNGELQPSCEVLRQAMAPIYRIQRTLELYGAAGCPEVAEAWRNVEKQVQRTVRFLLQEKQTFQKLACYRGLSTAGLLGDMDGPYWEAVKAAEAAVLTK
jgi:hypothetical protein